MFKKMVLQVIGGLAIALLVLVSIAYSSPIDWNGFNSEVDAALDRAEARTDTKYGVEQYLTTLDGIIEKNHRLFVKKHELQIKSLICRKRTDIMLAQYRDPNARWLLATDSNKAWVDSLYLEAFLEVSALRSRVAAAEVVVLNALREKDWTRLDILMKILKRDQLKLVDELVKKRELAKNKE